LKQVLQAHLNWHGARISFLALFLLALLKVKTVNLSELCLGFGGKALPESSYKRLQRFFQEFIGQAWVRYLLLEPALAFRLRIRGSDQIEHDGKVLADQVVFAHLQVGQSQRLTGTCWVWGYLVAVEALRLDDGELLVVIAPVKAQDLVKDYALRWGIETLFGIFKTRGFCLESSHFTDDERLSKLFALLTPA